MSRKKCWSLENKLFLVKLMGIGTIPQLIEGHVPPSVAKRQWTRVSRKFRREFGWTVPPASMKIRWENMRRRTETLMDDNNQLTTLKEPEKSIQKLLKRVNNNNDDEAKRNVSSTQPNSSCVECGELYDRCGRCHSSTASPFNINGRPWATDWLNGVIDKVDVGCEEDPRVRRLSARWNELRRKNQLEETRLSGELMALRTKTEKLKLEIVEYQHQEASIKVETAKIKRTLMEYMFSERVSVPDDSANDNVVI